MYVEKGKNLATKTIAKALTAQLADSASYRPKDYMRIKAEMAADPELLLRTASNLKALNDALLKGRSVYATCDRQPRGNLDSGRHYYSIYSTSVKGQIERLNLSVFSLLLGGTENKRHRDLHYWIFESSAIGMSRLLDATNGVFTFLKSIGGCYTQLDCL